MKLYVKKRDNIHGMIIEIDNLIEILNKEFYKLYYEWAKPYEEGDIFTLNHNKTISRTIWYLERVKKYLEMKEGDKKCKATISRKSGKNSKN